MTEALYDAIGRNYALGRCADPRIVDGLVRSMGVAAGSVIAEIGAGTGNYSRALAERGFRVLAIEPSATMRAQATPHSGIAWHNGPAERIPLADRSAAAVIAILSFHHFSDSAAALHEMHRVAGDGRIVIFTCDLTRAEVFWLQHYFPFLRMFDPVVFPPLEGLIASIRTQTGRVVATTPFPLPHDLLDGFGSAYWRRPEAYLDPAARAGISAFAMADGNMVESGLELLKRDLKSGEWLRQHGAVLSRPEFDAGYFFVTARVG